MPHGPQDAGQTDAYLRDVMGVTPEEEKRMAARAIQRKAEEAAAAALKLGKKSAEKR